MKLESPNGQSPIPARKSYRIAMVAACPFPANHGTPGAIREMSETLGEMGHEVHIVTYPVGQEQISLKLSEVHRPGRFRSERNVTVGPSAKRAVMDIALLRLLCRVVRTKRIDVIHANAYEGALIGALAGRITRRPVVYHAVNLMSDELAGYGVIRPKWLAESLARFLDWLVPIFPDHIIALTPELKEALLARGTPEGKISLIRCGIKPELFDQAESPALADFDQIGDRPVVMYTGVLNAFQRIDYLLRSFALVLGEEPRALLVLLSAIISEADKVEHVKLAEELGISHAILWLGPHSLAELPGYLALADVTVVSRPRCPGHPIKLLNYMLAAKPIVCFEGAAKGLRHMHDAMLVPDDDWRAFGHAILTLLRTPELREQLGNEARASAIANFDWANICSEIEAVYGKVVRAKPRTSHLVPSSTIAAEAYGAEPPRYHA